MPAIKSEVEIDVEIWCSECNTGLCRTVTISGNNIYVPPCSKCMKIERDTGYEEGYDKGFDEADGRG